MEKEDAAEKDEGEDLCGPESGLGIRGDDLKPSTGVGDQGRRSETLIINRGWGSEATIWAQRHRF